MPVDPHVPPGMIRTVAQAFAPAVDKYGTVYPPLSGMGFTVVQDAEEFSRMDTAFRQIDPKTGRTLLDGWKSWNKDRRARGR